MDKDLRSKIISSLEIRFPSFSKNRIKRLIPLLSQIVDYRKIEDINLILPNSTNIDEVYKHLRSIRHQIKMEIKLKDQKARDLAYKDSIFNNTILPNRKIVTLLSDEKNIIKNSILVSSPHPELQFLIGVMVKNNYHFEKTCDRILSDSYYAVSLNYTDCRFVVKDYGEKYCFFDYEFRRYPSHLLIYRISLDNNKFDFDFLYFCYRSYIDENNFTRRKEIFEKYNGFIKIISVVVDHNKSVNNLKEQPAVQDLARSGLFSVSVFYEKISNSLKAALNELIEENIILPNFKTDKLYEENN